MVTNFIRSVGLSRPSSLEASVTFVLAANRIWQDAEVPGDHQGGPETGRVHRAKEADRGGKEAADIQHTFQKNWGKWEQSVSLVPI